MFCRLIRTLFSALFLSFLLGVVSVSAATFTVNSLNDADDGLCDGAHCSLKEAVNAANSNSGADSIVFSVTGTITQGNQPQINEEVDIDGDSAGVILSKGLAVNSSANKVKIRGLTILNPGEAALYFNGSSSTIGGSDITDRNIFLDDAGNNGTAIQIAGTNNTIENNYINVQADGVTKDSSRDGILVMTGATGTVIKNNVITSGGGCAIYLFGPGGSIGATLIQGNRIGVSADGTTSISPFTGICDRGDLTINGLLTIGGVNSSDRNIISGAVTQGLILQGTYTGGILIKNNYIGTNAAGTSALPNGDGVVLAGSFNSGTFQFGGSLATEANVVSGNSQEGISLANTSNWAIKGNLIGVNAAGDGDLGNGTSGIHISGTSTNVIIGDATNYNVISGNGGQGIHVQDATGTLSFPGNRIGTNKEGSAAIANDGSGIWFQGSTFTATIGDQNTATPTSIISGNVDRGIRIENGTVNVYSSIIGLNATQTAAIPNGTGITGSATVGNTRTAGYNVIAGNNGRGIWGEGTIKGNFIGVNSSQNAVFANNGHGIYVENGGGVVIGGASEGEGNVIGGQTGGNIQILLDTNVMGASVLGNYIGLYTNGTPISGSGGGISVKGQNIIIGSTSINGRNYLGSLNGGGIKIGSSAENSNIQILNNYIGVAPDGITSRGITGNGIEVSRGKGIYIGVNDAGTEHAGNLISGNTGEGIYLSAAAGAVDIVRIEGNRIGVNAAENSKISNNNGIKVAPNVSHLTIGGADNNSRNVISGNQTIGINLNNISNAVIQGNYIGTNSLNAPNIGNGGNGITISGDSDNNVIGFTYSDTLLDDSKRNISNYNGGYGLYLGQVGSVSNTIRGNFIGPDNASGRIMFDQNPNNGISLSGTAFTSKDTSKVAGTTNLADGTKVDIYNIDTAGTGHLTFYEGSTAVSAGVFELNQDFDAVAGDTYLVQFTEADGDSSKYLEGTVVADTTLPAMPEGLMSQTVTNPSYTFNGTKDPWTKIQSVTMPGFIFTDLTGFTGSTSWSYTVTLDEGDNDYSFVARDFSGNASLQKDVTVTLDGTAPSVPTITSATSASGTGATASFTVTGTKDAGTSIYLNDTLVVAEDQLTTWSYNTTLNVGVNVIGPFVSKDAVQNASASVSTVVTYTQEEEEEEEPVEPVYYGGGGGSGGSAPSNNTNTTTTTTPTVTTPTTPATTPTATTQPQVNSTTNQNTSTSNTTDSTNTTKDDKSFLSGLFGSADEKPSFDVKMTTPVATQTAGQDLTTREGMFDEDAYATVTGDDDKDMVPDTLEMLYFGSMDVLDVNADSDGDGITDGDELLLGTNLRSADSDGDGVSDADEIAAGTSSTSADTDNDGLTDAEEQALGTKANQSDSDGDGFSDFVEIHYGGNVSNAGVKVRDDDGDGAADQWEEEFGMKEVDYNKEEYFPEIEKSIKLKMPMRDTDGDGLSDWVEMNRGTDPNKADTDGDGLTDGEEVNIYLTNPLTATTDQNEIYKPRISNVKQGTVFTDKKAVVTGVATPNSKVTVYFLPRDWDAPEGVIAYLGRMMFTDLFAELPTKVYEKEIETDQKGKFLIEEELPNGRFDVVVRVYDENGELKGETLPYVIEVDTDKVTGKVEPYRLDTEDINLVKMSILEIANSRPLLYGRAPRGYEIQTMWASELFSSSLIMDVDDETGEFVVLSPMTLGEGDHEVKVQGVDLTQNLYTAAVNVDFLVTGGIVTVADQDSNTRMKVIGVGLGAVLLLAVFWFMSHGKKEHPEN